MSRTRPYFVTHCGKRHLIEAISQAAAISKVVAPHVTDVRVATASEVVAWYKNQAAASPKETASADELLDLHPSLRHPIGEDLQD